MISIHPLLQQDLDRLSEWAQIEKSGGRKSKDSQLASKECSV